MQLQTEGELAPEVLASLAGVDDEGATDADEFFTASSAFSCASIASMISANDAGSSARTASAENFTGLGPEYLRFAVRAPGVVDDLSRALESVLEEVGSD